MNNNNYINLIISGVILLCASYIYNKFKLTNKINDNSSELNIIKKHLFNNEFSYDKNSILNNKKPFLWVYIDYKKNSRKWTSFYSRTSNDLNQDYLSLTIQSIIKKCSNDFYIVLIDSSSFELLLDDWNSTLSTIGPLNDNNYNNLGIIKLLNRYGGISIEPNNILFKSLKPIYDTIKSSNKMVVGEYKNKSSFNHIKSSMPSIKFIGCLEKCKKCEELLDYLMNLYLNDYTNESNLENNLGNWLLNNTNNNSIDYLNGQYIGTKDINNKIIDLEVLMSSNNLELNDKSFGLYIPSEELLKRTNYNWFIYLDESEVLKSNTNISKYLLINN